MEKLTRSFVIPSLSDCFENMSKINTGLYRDCYWSIWGSADWGVHYTLTFDGKFEWYHFMIHCLNSFIWELVARMAYLWRMNCSFSTTPQIHFVQWMVIRKASTVWIQRSHDITINDYLTEHLIDARMVEQIF